MTTFKVGDKVRYVKTGKLPWTNSNNKEEEDWAEKDGLILGKEYTIRQVASDGDVFIKEGESNLRISALHFELVSTLTNTIIHSIKDADQHKRVQEKLESMGLKPCASFTERDMGWPVFIIFDDGEFGNYREPMCSYKNNISASEFLGEDVPVIINKETSFLTSEAIENARKCLGISDLNITQPEPCVGKVNKIMSVITNAFKSKENKALELFGFGNTEELSGSGREEFVNYIFETGDTSKKGFFAKIVEAYKEIKK